MNIDPNDPINKIILEATKSTALEVYKDGLQPAVREVGKGLETIVKAVSIALHPLRDLVWRYEQISQYLEPRISQRLAQVDPEKIQPPDIAIAGPAMEAMRFTAQSEHLQGMFADLIATSMDSNVANRAHPGFVEVIKQLSADEALLLKHMSNGHNYFFTSDVLEYVVDTGVGYIVLKNLTEITYKAGLVDPKSSAFYLDNLMRLELIHKSASGQATEEHNAWVNVVMDQLRLENERCISEGSGHLKTRYEVARPHSLMQVSTFGSRFIASCVNPDWQAMSGL